MKMRRERDDGIQESDRRKMERYYRSILEFFKRRIQWRATCVHNINTTDGIERYLEESNTCDFVQNRQSGSNHPVLNVRMNSVNEAQTHTRRTR